VYPDLVLPSPSETKLSKPQQPSQQPAASTRHRVDAFFAKKVDDHGIDVHAEGQLMMREIMNPVNAGSPWDCNVNPQPTLKDLRTSIASCSQRNVRVLHLAGHGRKECGFIWNANDDAKESKEFDVDAIALAIGMAAGAKGPLECAVLNACSTEKMGRLLRTHNVPCVICWKTPVQDETAKALCELFYRALVEDASGKRDYKAAFLAATNALRLSAHTGGIKTKPRGETEDMIASTSLLHRGTTRSISPQEAGSSRGPVRPWHEEDVVLFLSNDGDSDPIYLWREKPAPALSNLAPADAITIGAPDAADSSVDAELQAFFEQYGLGDVCADVCKELEVEGVRFLAYVKSKDLDDLPKYLVDKHRIRKARKAALEQLVQDAQSQKAIARKGKLEQLVQDGPSRKTSVAMPVPLPPASQCPSRVFLGYRVASDADLVERLHDKLKAEGVQVWWDKRCLPAGQPWEQGFADGLCCSDVFVPVLSKAALANYKDLTAASACDNVLLEHQLALELQHRGDLRAIFPILVGELRHDTELGDIHGDFFKGGGMPTCKDDVTVKAVEGKLFDHLQRLGKGVPQLPAAARTVKATLAAITNNQGVKLVGVRSDTVDNVVAALVKLATGGTSR